MTIYESIINLWAGDATLQAIADSSLIFPGKAWDPTIVPPYITITTEDDTQSTVTSKSIIDEEVIRISVFTDSHNKSRSACARLRTLLREKRSLTADDGEIITVRRVGGGKQPMTKGVQLAYDDYAITKSSSR